MRTIQHLKASLLVLMSIMLSTNALGQGEIDYKEYVWDYEPKFDVPKVDGDYSEIIVKDKRVLEFVFEGRGFYQYDLRHEVTYIASEAGVEDNNKIYLTTSDDDEVIYQRARVINSKGELIKFDEKDIEEGQDEESGYTYKYFALDGLDIGSFVELQFLIKKTGMHNGIRKSFQRTVPKRNFDFEFICPESLVFSFNSLNNFPEVEFDTTMSEKNYWKVSLDSIPAYEDEPMSYTTPNLQGVVYKLSENHYSGAKDIGSYGSVAKNYFSFVYESVEKSDQKAIKKFLKSLGVKKDMKEEEKILMVENHLKQNFAILPFVNPELSGVKNLLENKASDESSFIRLYANAFKQLGIKHQIVLTSDRSNLRFDKKFESYNYLQSTFFYFPDLDLFLDPSSPGLRLGFIPSENTNNYGLFIRELKIGDIVSGIGKVKYIKALHEDKSQNNHFVKVDMTEDPFEPEISFEQHMSGYYSSFLQTSYSLLSEDEKERVDESLVEMVTLEQSETDLEILNATSADFGKTPMILKATVNSLKFTEKAGDKIIFKIGELIGPQTEMYNEKPRVHDVETDFNRKYVRVIEVDLPEDYEVSNLEKLNFDVALEDGTAIFKSNYKVEGNKLTVEVDEYYSRIDFKVEEFEDYKKVINAAADFNKVVIYLSKKS